MCGVVKLRLLDVAGVFWSGDVAAVELYTRLLTSGMDIIAGKRRRKTQR
jgi:hypothetical protein